jgi:FkbM family methyltransferase
MKFEHSPDSESAKQILRQLVQLPITCSARKVDKSLVLFGAGNLGLMARQFFEKVGIHFDYVVDSNPVHHRADPFWAGIDVLAPAEVPREERSSVLMAICVATTPFSTLSGELGSMGWTDLVPFYDIAEAYRDRHPLGNGWFAGRLNQTDIENIELTLTDWQDATSRAHHLQFIAWHALREDWLFDDSPVTIGDRYFIPEVLSLLHSDEVFCDLGAHHAEVIVHFLQTSENRFKEIWAIEPDAENLAHLRAELQKLAPWTQEKISVLPCAVAAQNGRSKFFQGLGYASQLCDIGPDVIDVKTVDQLHLAPTFLKLHLEGGELDAMRGGLQTLKRYRPIIAATTYHNRQGLWEGPRWLMEELQNYTFIFRLHSWCGTGAVVYGIPNERMSKGGANAL